MTKKQIIFFCILSISISACQEVTGPKGPPGPSLTGTLTGFVYLYDQYGQRMLFNPNTKVKIAGTTDSTATDTSGKYTFNNLATGTYDMYYSNPGYGTFKRSGLQFLGGGIDVPGNINLGSTPTFIIENDSVYKTSATAQTITWKGTLGNSDSTKAKDVQYFVGPASTVSSDPSTYLYTVNVAASGKNTYSSTVTYINLLSNGFTHGQTIYIIGYPVVTSATTYEDVKTGRSIYPSLGVAGKVHSIILP